MTPSSGLRARVRAELTAEIKAEARRQLAEEGATGLSLRAVTRSLGMAPSAIYRYFKNRDELLTALIVDAYDAMGAEAEAADARCARSDFGGRWLAVARAVREWARSTPHEYALLYGSPVPGYRAPEDTVGPASRISLALAAVIRDAQAAGVLDDPVGFAVTPETANDALRIGDLAMPDVPPAAVVRTVEAWTQLFGWVSFELFGQFVGVIEHPTAFFEDAALDMARHIGLPAPR